MNTTTTVSTVDRIAMALGGALVLLGTLVMGVVETLVGNPNAVPLTNDAGVVVADTTFDPTLRATIVLAGLLVFGLYAVYRVVATPPRDESQRQPVHQPAD